MDWVDFKKYVRQYRRIYQHLPIHAISDILLLCVAEFAKYRDYSRKGYEDWQLAQRYGQFLWHYAELQNLTVEHITEQGSNYEEWELVGDAVNITRDFQTDGCTDTEAMARIANWCRRNYGFISTQRHFYDGMNEFRRGRNEH